MTANDIDASVRSVNVNEPHAVTYSATLVPPALGKLVVVGFGANCKPNMLPFYAVSGQGVPFPFGTRYVAAWPADRFAQMTWQLH